MNSLEQFLALQDVNNITADIDVNERLANVFGKFKIKAMTEADYKDYQRKANYKVDKKGSVAIDTAKFFISMVAGQTLYPDFHDPEVLAKFGCATAEELVAKKLLIGEIISIGGKIQDLSGFSNDINQTVEEAKN